MSLAARIARPTRPTPLAVGRRTLLGVAAAFVALAGWGAASACYFLFRDDIAVSLIARQNAMRQAYEEKIGVLRGRLDRLASQNLLDRDGLDRRIAEIMARQAQLEARQAVLMALPDLSPEARTGSIPQDVGAPMPAAAPPALPALSARPKPTPVPDSVGLRLREREAGPPDPAQQSSDNSRPKGSARDRLAQVQRSLAALEATQLQGLDRLLRGAETRVSALHDAFREAGLNPEAMEGSPKEGVGGPLIPLPTGAGAGPFAAMLERLRTSVAQIEHLNRTAAALPFRKPVPGDIDLTSGFGYRIDPFTRAPAMHTGLDFGAEHGAPVRAAGAGQVVAAEYAGGYGNMVEIDHGNGVTSRYAHLSSIGVSPGDAVAAGAIIGRAGSTGRSTGAHLHYETRIDGEAVDPQRFLRAGARLRRL